MPKVKAKGSSKRVEDDLQVPVREHLVPIEKGILDDHEWINELKQKARQPTPKPKS